MNIIFFIDSKKKGIVSYDQIQQFLNKYCKIFSELIELQIISCNISKYNFSNAEKYFNNNKIKNVINDEKSVKEEEHNLILNNLCSNDINKKNLFIYLANNENSYDLIKLIDLLNYYLELDSTKNYNLKNEDNENINDNILPDKSIVENILKEINLGINGNISINEFIMKLKKNYRKQLISKLDKDKKGYLTFPEFINQLIKIYGTDIDLNYKLCAQIP